MALRFGPLFAALALLFLIALAAPAAAHHHDNEAAEANEAGAAAVQPNAHAPAPLEHMAGHHHEEARPTTFGGRLLAWAGHMHPVAVHFPVALFPISWLALLLARRRGNGAEIVRMLIIVTGLMAVAAATLGWLDAGAHLSDEDPVMTAHRWLGTTMALIGAAIALLAWRTRAAAAGTGMAWALGLATLLVFVQGGLGAVLTHGAEHLAF
jgi:hypothetical protein